MTVDRDAVRRSLRRVAGAVVSLPALLLVATIRAYQLLVSPMLGPVCRFYPSCSHYAVGALRTHGALRGTGLTLWRLARCHPWNPGGVDLVPPARAHDHLAPRRAASAAGGAATPDGAADQSVRAA